MAARTSPAPPRPLAPGDVVTTFSDRLGAWTAAQITDLNPEWRVAGVLALDWSGVAPPSVADLHGVSPLRLTHHAHTGRLAHTNFGWLLPRSYRVIGSMALLHTAPSNAYGGYWDLGDQLAYQRQWDSGERGPLPEPHRLLGTASEIHDLLASDGSRRGDITDLAVMKIDSLDCRAVVETFPNLKKLTLSGHLGTLEHAGALNRLTSLRVVWIENLFGMSPADRLDPGQVRYLDALGLHSVPADYAAATRSAWRPQVSQGTQLDITGARKPEWVEANRSNPLRDWDGRDHISAGSYKKSVLQYRSTQAALVEALRDLAPEDLAPNLERIGREYGEAFNRLSARTGFIETEEREDLFDAIIGIIADAENALSRDLTAEKEQVLRGLEAVRDW